MSTPAPSPPPEARSPLARRAARAVILLVDLALLLGAAWFLWEVREAWGAWRQRVAQVGVAQVVGEDPINQDDPLLGWKHAPGRSVPMEGFGPDVVWTINANGLSYGRSQPAQVR